MAQKPKSFTAVKLTAIEFEPRQSQLAIHAVFDEKSYVPVKSSQIGGPEAKKEESRLQIGLILFLLFFLSRSYTHNLILVN